MVKDLNNVARIVPNKYIRDRTYVNNELRAMLAYLKEHEDVYTKVELFRSRDYSLNRFSEWNRKFGDNPRTRELFKKIEEILEARLIVKGLKAPNPAFIIFLLKNNYGYQDKREVETEHTHVFKVTRGDLKALKAKQVPSTATIK